MDKVTHCLWYEGNVLEADELYTSLIPNSAIGQVHLARADTPGGKEGTVLLVEFNLDGRSFQALNGGPHDKFNDAVSMSIRCEDQTEVDRLWDALTRDGGRSVQCGWLKDKYGLSWQIVPKQLIELMSGPDRERGKRVMQAMMEMVKIDIAGLQRAADDS